jgi:hypothetical protein
LEHTRKELDGQIMLRGQLLSALALSAGLLASAKPAFKETFDGEMFEPAYCGSRRHKPQTEQSRNSCVKRVYPNTGPWCRFMGEAVEEIHMENI